MSSESTGAGGRAGKPAKIIIAELMSSCGFPVARHLYGQTFLKIDLLTGFSLHSRLEVEWHLIGSGLNTPSGLASVKEWEVDIARDPLAYASVIRRLCKKGTPVVAVSSFAMDDSALLMPLSLLRRDCPNLRLVVLLHCMRHEYIRRILVPSPADVQPGVPHFDHNARSIGWLSLLKSDGRWDFIDSYVAVSDEVKRSFASPDPYLGEVLPKPEKVTIIPNGVDREIYHPPAGDLVDRYKNEIGMNASFVVGTTAGWKQYKGSAILREILRHYARDPAGAPDFLFPLIPDYSGRLLLEDLAMEGISNLVSGGRIHLFFDIAKWQKLPNRDEIRRSYEDLIAELEKDLPAPLGDTFRSCWRGLVDYPVQWLMDLYLRPSLAEAFGRGPWEARMCGVETIVADRDALAGFGAEACVTLPDDLLIGKKESAGSLARAAGRFIERIERARSETDGGPIAGSSRRASSSCSTVPEMVERYENHFISLFER